MYVKKILNLALPAMGEQVLQMAMGTVDSYLVARLGLVAISGVSVANQLMSIYQAIFIGLATSAASLLARHRSTAAQQYLGSSLGLTAIVGLVLGGIALSMGQVLFGLIGLSGDTQLVASQYFAWVGGSALLLGLMTVLSSLVRVQGKTGFPLLVNALSSVLNIFLSTIFLFGFDWGLTGVALGTVLARGIGCVLLWSALADKPNQWSAYFRSDWQVLSFSLPLIGERLMMRAGDLVVMGGIVGLGTRVLAAHALGETLVQFTYLPALSLALATVILVAQETDVSHQKRLVTELYLLSLFLMFVVSIALFLFNRPLLNLFTADAEVMALAKIVLLFAVLDVPVVSGTLILTATWQGLGQPKLPFYATTIGMWLIRVGGTVMLAPLIGLWGICLPIALDNAFRTVYLFWKYRQYCRQDVKLPLTENEER